MLVEGRNAGFVLATPIGLVLAGVFAATSSFEYRLEQSLWIVRHGRLLLGLVLVLIAGWAVVSLAEVPPLRDAVTPQDLETPLAAVATVGAVCYAIAAVSYLRVFLRRRSGLALAVALAFTLLAEALVVVVVSLRTSWQLSWWEWHGLMVIGFVAIAAAAWREWHEERFSALYLEETLRGEKEVTVLFADLVGFTPFTEYPSPRRRVRHAARLLRPARSALRDEFGGDVHEFVGDQIFAVFNKEGDQPDHAVQAARAALALQRVAAETAAGTPSGRAFASA